MRATSRLLAVVTLLLGVVGLSACGSETDTSTAGDPAASRTPATPSNSAPPASSEAQAQLPECDEVWREGARLPTGYPGCSANGEEVKPDRIRCSFGLVMVTYDDRFYAIPGDTINEVDSLKSDPDFRRTVDSCQA